MTINMEHRDFGKRSGFRIPRANIGAMRFPADLDEAVELIRYAIDSGMMYIDTCRMYGDSEIKLGHALKDGYREKVILSTKWSPWIAKVDETDDTSADCMRRRIEESMERLQVDYLDFYQVWNIINREVYEQATAKDGMLDGIQKAMADGLVNHTGFTTHDTPENLLSYMDDIDWCEIMLVTCNIMNTTYIPVLEAAHKRGIGTVVMNPVGGGMLTQPSAVLLKLAAEMGTDSIPHLALRYLMSNDNMDTVIVGISKKSDVDSAVAAANDGPLAEDEMAQLDEFVRSMSREHVGFCTECKYCLPCPQGINIPFIMNLVYHDRFWGFADGAKHYYTHLGGPKADACTECGACEEKCTQHLKITEEMKLAHERYGSTA